MVLRSVKNRIVEAPTAAGKKRESGSSTAALVAPSFPAALGIIFSKQEKGFITSPSIRALRLTSKAVRHAVDLNVHTFTFLNDPSQLGQAAGNGAGSEDRFFRNLSPWRWPNITKFVLGSRRVFNANIIQRDFADLLALSLPKLDTLHLNCLNVMPLLQSNWPMLTYLELAVQGVPWYHATGRSPAISYPKNLKFPKMPLKRLHLRIDETANAAFVRPLLKSCPELIHLELDDGMSRKPSKGLAVMVESAPLTQLTCLQITSDASPAFWTKLLAKNWSALKDLKLYQSEVNLVPILASNIWITNLERLELMNHGDLPADELHAFLKILEKGEIQVLALNHVNYKRIKDAFNGIELEHLKVLDLERMNDDIDIGFEAGLEVSDFINTLFDGCSFPKLEKMSFGSNRIQFLMDDQPRWHQPPPTSVEQLRNSCPLLKDISMIGLDISRATADFLGSFRRETGCRLHLLGCTVIPRELSPERQHLLARLGLGLSRWGSFCETRIGGQEFIEDFMYWDNATISSDVFKLSAYAAAIHSIGGMPFMFDRLVAMCLAEEGGLAMLAEVNRLLRTGEAIE